MTIPDETLMAYADDELDPIERARVEAEMRDDPRMMQRVARHRDLRATLQKAYAGELDEPLPQRLLSAVRNSDRPASTVVDIAAARVRAVGARQAAGRSRNPSWRAIGSLAASLLIGLGAGYLAWHHSDSSLIQTVGDTLVAGGALAQDLSNQLAGDRSPASTAAIGLSFVEKSGDYCRTFTLSADTASAGLACRRAQRWEIRLLTQTDAVDAQSEDYRTAHSAISPAILSAVEQRISGEPLDRAAEISARTKNWQVP